MERPAAEGAALTDALSEAIAPAGGFTRR